MLRAMAGTKKEDDFLSRLEGILAEESERLPRGRPGRDDYLTWYVGLAHAEDGASLEEIGDWLEKVAPTSSVYKRFPNRKAKEKRARRYLARYEKLAAKMKRAPVGELTAEDREDALRYRLRQFTERLRKPV